MSGLDVEKMETLQRWGRGLQSDPREEVAAAGRAILLLIEEIERLHVLIWGKQLFPELPPSGFPAQGADPVVAEEARSRWSLSEVLSGRLPEDRDDLPQPKPAPDEPFHT